MSKNPTTLREKFDQGRAKYAFECASKARGKSFEGNYKSYVKKLPSLIQTNGLGQAIAFVKSNSGTGGKRKQAYSALYNNISEWLVQNNLINEGELIEQIISKTSSEYRHITVEVLALLNWLRRFVDGLIEKEEEGE